MCLGSYVLDIVALMSTAESTVRRGLLKQEGCTRNLRITVGTLDKVRWNYIHAANSTTRLKLGTSRVRRRQNVFELALIQPVSSTNCAVLCRFQARRKCLSIELRLQETTEQLRKSRDPH